MEILEALYRSGAASVSRVDKPGFSTCRLTDAEVRLFRAYEISAEQCGSVSQMETVYRVDRVTPETRERFLAFGGVPEVFDAFERYPGSYSEFVCLALIQRVVEDSRVSARPAKIDRSSFSVYLWFALGALAVAAYFGPDVTMALKLLSALFVT